MGAAGETWPLARGGNLASEEAERELPIGFRRRPWEPLHPVSPAPGPAVSAAGLTAGCWAAGELLSGYPCPRLSFDFLDVFSAPGRDGAAPGFLESSGPGDPAQVQLPRLWGAPLQDQSPFPPLSSPPAWMRRENHC